MVSKRVHDCLQAYVARVLSLVPPAHTTTSSSNSRLFARDRRFSELIHQHAGLAVALHSVAPTALTSFQPLLALPGKRRAGETGLVFVMRVTTGYLSFGPIEKILWPQRMHNTLSHTGKI